MFTFCDGGELQVLQAIKKEKIPVTYCYKFNNSVLFQKPGDDLEKIYWNIGVESVKKFF